MPLNYIINDMNPESFLSNFRGSCQKPFREHMNQSRQLPDDHSLLLWKEHGTVGDVKGIVEGMDVA